ncbi:hypothetical protein DFP72DRAFT_911381 [Ephemerocybe angulata]|uniref:Uncharacterized protein n=1 Tax=Ephemerocybe angulata TaxID=980116 RepID=A0A8H6HPD8_9AGAR|nr:hypothetical protein DFP72DRAFT_1174036 [Tulosesus angulatus]KAF6750221.1 hypothetical protein DFP72DRAFT_911381 [Tulosesus angulatus]
MDQSRAASSAGASNLGKRPRAVKEEETSDDEARGKRALLEPVPKPVKKEDVGNAPAPASNASQGSENPDPRLRSAAPASVPPPRPQTPRVTYKKHPRHWKSDGSVYVVLGLSVYRLYRSRLVESSAWFNEVLKASPSGPTPSASAKGKEPESGAGVVLWNAEANGTIMPTVKLDGVEGVNQRDWERLLDAMDDAISYVHREPPTHVVLSILRVSLALQFLHFLNWAKRTLSEAWSGELLATGGFSEKGLLRLEDAPDVVAVGRMCGLPSVVKRAMYELLKDQTFGQGAGGKSLSTEDIMRLVHLRSSMQRMWVQQTTTYPPDLLPCRVPLPPKPPGQQKSAHQGPVCIALHKHLAARDVHRKLVIESGIQDAFMCDFFNGMKELVNLPWASEGFCADCVGRLHARWGWSMTKPIWDRCTNLVGV